MPYRIEKIENQLRQLVATELFKLLGQVAARVTVTRVDAAPDLKTAIIWIGLLEEGSPADKLWKRVYDATPVLQAALSQQLSLRYVPRLELKRDSGGAYAASIERLLRNI